MPFIPVVEGPASKKPTASVDDTWGVQDDRPSQRPGLTPQEKHKLEVRERVLSAQVASRNRRGGGGEPVELLADGLQAAVANVAGSALDVLDDSFRKITLPPGAVDSEELDLTKATDGLDTSNADTDALADIHDRIEKEQGVRLSWEDPVDLEKRKRVSEHPTK